MNHKYFPHTEEEIQQMLKVAGVDSLDGLYADVPEDIRFKGDYEIADAMSELPAFYWDLRSVSVNRSVIPLCFIL